MNTLPALTCISSMATRQLLGTLCERWTTQEGQTVHLESVGGVDAVRRIESGEHFDVAVLASDALDKLAAAGHVRTVRAVAVSEIAIAAAAGASPPVGTVAQLLETLQSSRAIGYSTGPSGKALLALLSRWGVLEVLQSRLVQAPPGVPVGELIARGTLDLGFQQRSELIHCPGIALLGPMPPGAEVSTVFSAAAGASGMQPSRASSFIAHLTSASSHEDIRREGMEPALAARLLS
jgi:molybdate transport system substrate-binding protein